MARAVPSSGAALLAWERLGWGQEVTLPPRGLGRGSEDTDSTCSEL